MSFNTRPLASPMKVEGTLNSSQAAKAARERAIAKLSSGNEPQQNQASENTPVQNPTQVSPEELGAIKAKTPVESNTNVEAVPKSEGQINNSDGSKEPPKEVTPVKSEVEQPLSSQYAQLARKEKALRVQAQAIKAREEAFKAQEASLKSKETEMQSQFISKDRLTKDPMAVLAESGISYEQLTQLALNAPSAEAQAYNAELSSLKAEIKALKDGQENARKSFEDNQKNAYDQTLTQIKNQVSKLVAEEGDNYETVKATNSIQDVVDLIEKTYNADHVLLTVEEAAQAVEDHLVEEAVKIAKLKKIQSRLKPAESNAAPKVTETQQSKQSQVNTLTNAVGGSQRLSARDRALLAFKGNKV